MINRTYKYRLYPTKNQRMKLDTTIDTCRILYNSALLDRINRYKNTGKGLSYNEQASIVVKDKEKHECLNKVYAQILQDVLRRVDKAFANFFRRLKQKHTKAGYPRFKGEDRLHSFAYPQKGFSIEDNKLKLSKIGSIKLKLHRELNGKIKTCTIKKEIDRWYVCFIVEIEKNIIKKVVSNPIGIDVGIKNFATLSNGDTIENPKYLRKSEDRLTRAQKLLSRKKKGSHNRRKQRTLVAKQHRKIKNQRLDFHHKVSKELVNKYDLIAHEDLNIKGMVKNHNFAKSISDVGWGQFVGFVKYKAEEAGIYAIPINPRNTSQLCSHCGQVVKKDLSVRVHKCSYCGLELDRDHNAALNILNKAWNEPLLRDKVLNLPVEARNSYS